VHIDAKCTNTRVTGSGDSQNLKWLWCSQHSHSVVQIPKRSHDVLAMHVASGLGFGPSSERFRQVRGHPEPEHELLVQFSPNPEPRTEPRSGSVWFGFGPKFRTKLRQPYTLSILTISPSHGAVPLMTPTLNTPSRPTSPHRICTSHVHQQSDILRIFIFL